MPNKSNFYRNTSLVASGKSISRTDRLTEHSFLTTDGRVGWVYNEHCTFTASIKWGGRRTDEQIYGRTD